MNLKNEQGFSLIELIMVTAIIGIVAALAVPSLKKTVVAAENSSAVSNIRTFGQAQANFYSQNNRYARLDELNTAQRDNLGDTLGDDIVRGPFLYTLTSSPTDEALRTGYGVIATRSNASQGPFVISIDQSGVITQIAP